MAIDKKNALWNSTSFIFLSIASFITLTITYKIFGADNLGLFLVISSIFGLGTNFDFGFGLSSIKYISEFKTENNYKKINTFISTFLIVYFFIAAVLIFFVSLYFWFFIKDSNVTQNFSDSSVNSIFIFLSFAFFFKYITNYFKVILEAFRKFVLLSKFNVLINIFNIILFCTLFYGTHTIIYVAVLNFIYNFVSFLVFFIVVFRFNKEIKINFKNFSFGYLKQFSVYGINIQISSFFSSLIDTAIKFILGNFLNLSYVTYFELSKKVIDFSNGLINSAQKGIFNTLSEEQAQNKLTKYVNDDLFKYSLMSNFYSILIYGVINPILCYFISIWAHNQDTVVIFLIFAMPYSLINFGASLYQVIMIEGKGGTLVIIQIINVLSISVFLFVCIKLFANFLGLFSFFAATIVSIGILFYYLKKWHNFSQLNYFKQTKFNDIIKLNLLLLIEIYFIYNYPNYFNYILIAFIFIFSLIYYKYMFRLFEKTKEILRTRKSTKFLNEL